jgi:hypothetical protein
MQTSIFLRKIYLKAKWLAVRDRLRGGAKGNDGSVPFTGFSSSSTNAGEGCCRGSIQKRNFPIQFIPNSFS